MKRKRETKGTGPRQKTIRSMEEKKGVKDQVVKLGTKREITKK
jgi:hypothetical protein